MSNIELVVNNMIDLPSIKGLEIRYNEKSKRIIDIQLKDDLVDKLIFPFHKFDITCLLYTSPSPRDQRGSRMPSSA